MSTDLLHSNEYENIALLKIEYVCFAAMMYRSNVATLKTLERKSNKVVVLKVIETTTKSDSLLNAMKQFEGYESRYLTKYLNTCVMEKTCQVMNM